MSNKKKPALFKNTVWRFFASVPFSILILISLAVTSILGTLIPQNQPMSAYLNAYGDVIFGVLNIFDVFDMYHSWWYQGLMMILVINLIVCSIDKMYATRKVLFAKKPNFKLSRFRKQPDGMAVTSQKSPGELKDICSDFLKGKFSVVETLETGEGFAVFAEKGRWSRMGVYAVHLSLVLLLFGAVLGSMYGFDGFVKINEGQSTSRIFLKDGNHVVDLDFKIRCDDFDVSFYENGSPKEYRSKLTLIRDGKEIYQKEIVVNDPLRFEGVNLFQSSYGTNLPKTMTVELTSAETGMTYTRKVGFNEKIEIPEDLGVFELINYTSDYDFRGQHLGEAYLGKLTSADGKTKNVELPVKFPSFDKMRKGKVYITVAASEKSYYTGLQVTMDPGVNIVYAGCIILILGCYITFFMSHQSVCMDIRKDGREVKVITSGFSNKNKIGMKNLVKQLARKITPLV